MILLVFVSVEVPFKPRQPYTRRRNVIEGVILTAADDEYSHKFPLVTGLSLEEVRRILKYRDRSYAYDHILTLAAPMSALDCGSAEADRHLRAMAEAGYLVHDSKLPLCRDSTPTSPNDFPGLEHALEKLRTAGSEGAIQRGRPVWHLTPLANQLQVEKLLKRMNRAAAEKLLESFLSEVDAINAEGETLLCITRVELFGSMLDPLRESYGDIDLFITQEARPLSEEIRLPLVEKLAEEALRTENFWISYEQPEGAAAIRSAKLNAMRLKKLGRRISLSSQAPEGIGTPFLMIYRYDPNTREVHRTSKADISRLAGQSKPPTNDLLSAPSSAPDAQTVGEPVVQPYTEPHESWQRVIIKTDDIVDRTASLMAIHPNANEPCPACQSWWCSHLASSSPAPVLENSADHHLVLLDAMNTERPLGHPFTEVQRSLDRLSTSGVDIGNRMGLPPSSARYLTISKSGLGLTASSEDADFISKYDPFAIKAGRFDLVIDLQSFAETDEFLAYMRLQKALLAIWAACSFTGGSEADIILDLTDPSLQKMQMDRLRVVGRFGKIIPPAQKQLVAAHPFPCEHAVALAASVENDLVYRPGSFDFKVDIDTEEVDVKIHCHARISHPDWRSPSSRELGSGEGEDPETETARSILLQKAQSLAGELRSLPGFVCASARKCHWLDYPEV